MSELDFMTEREKRLEERRQRVARTFAELRRQFPEMAPSRIAQAIAQDERLSIPGVIYILQRAGVWKGRGDD